MKSLHADKVNFSLKDNELGKYYEVIKTKEEHLTEGCSSPERILLRTKKRAALLETWEEVENSPFDNSHDCIEGTPNKSSIMIGAREIPAILSDNLMALTENFLLDAPNADIAEKILYRSAEEQIKVLPTYPLISEEHCHVHCEFCGHSTIVHGNHIDYLCEGELHFVDYSGAVYPHKLEASNTNPVKCQYLDNTLHDYNILSAYGCLDSSYDELEIAEVCIHQ